MNLSIREHIINNFKGDDYDTLRRAIDESVASQDEVTLPGMGVFMAKLIFFHGQSFVIFYHDMTIPIAYST